MGEGSQPQELTAARRRLLPLPSLLACPGHAGHQLSQRILAPPETSLAGDALHAQKLVVAESPSLEKAPADRCCRLLAAEWRKRGARVERIAQKLRGDQLRVTWWPQNRGPRANSSFSDITTLSIPPALSPKCPSAVSGGKAYGPGIFDMKAGIVQALFALETLQQTKAPLTHRLVFLWTSDEEIGSDSRENLSKRKPAAAMPSLYSSHRSDPRA